MNVPMYKNGTIEIRLSVQVSSLYTNAIRVDKYYVLIYNMEKSDGWNWQDRFHLARAHYDTFDCIANAKQ